MMFNSPPGEAMSIGETLKFFLFFETHPFILVKKVQFCRLDEHFKTRSTWPLGGAIFTMSPDPGPDHQTKALETSLF